ncbi:MAG: MFS transporter [Candidatus Pacebacteria bacterium]|jgi:MFS transporter, YQGE family, putative transporter|nr:MFS transporter [Candidatus Paceibacterota bacterium]MBT3511660.1 MFS transporter [Candidatus Paceibacterota bacterium]MBT4004491.1 MFS transporter [Candidatus Paceibacterota bacterium]MBT4358823.1 MFS transporter [Candidatus Paceibacterota bacterium]MBT4680647.1 MFS transporter [Candidatus Paceibacterota bacterium]
MLRDRLRRELSIFHQLRPDVQKFVLSIFCQIISNNLIFVFANAYLFISTNSISSIAVFNLGVYIMILLGFHLNAFLIKFMDVRRIFIPASILQGGSLAILFLFQTLSLWNIFSVGLIVGLSSGFYWANRNFIFPTLTEDRERDYISGIVTLVGNLSGVILPLLAGWLIVWSRTQPNFGAEGAYVTIMGFGVIVLFVGTIFLNSIKEFPTLKVTHFWPKKVSPDWKLFRTFVLASTMQMAVGATVVEAITLSFIGDEGVLGVIKSALAVVVGLIIYMVGRKMQPKDRFRLLMLSTLSLLVAVLLLLVNFGQLTLIIYITAMIVSGNLFWFVYIPIMSKATETQGEGLIADNYAYVLDHEFFINLGRVSSMLLILAAFHYLDKKLGVMTVIAAGAILQALGMAAARKLIRIQSH